VPECRIHGLTDVLLTTSLVVFHGVYSKLRHYLFLSPEACRELQITSFEFDWGTQTDQLFAGAPNAIVQAVREFLLKLSAESADDVRLG